MMGQWLGYHLDNTNRTLPIATGTTREEALHGAVLIIFQTCMLDGHIGVVERADLSVEDFKVIRDTITEVKAKHGLL